MLQTSIASTKTAIWGLWRDSKAARTWEEERVDLFAMGGGLQPAVGKDFGHLRGLGRQTLEFIVAKSARTWGVDTLYSCLKISYIKELVEFGPKGFSTAHWCFWFRPDLPLLEATWGRDFPPLPSHIPSMYFCLLNIALICPSFPSPKPKFAALNCSDLHHPSPGLLTHLPAPGSPCCNLFFVQMLNLSSKS